MEKESNAWIACWGDNERGAMGPDKAADIDAAVGPGAAPSDATRLLHVS